MKVSVCGVSATVIECFEYHVLIVEDDSRATYLVPYYELDHMPSSCDNIIEREFSNIISIRGWEWRRNQNKSKNKMLCQLKRLSKRP